MNSLKILLLSGFMFASTTQASMLAPSETEAFKQAVCGEKSCSFVFKKLRKYARSGNPKAQAALSLLYMTGTGTEKNTDEAIRHLKKSAKQGLAFAQYELGVLYIRGELVEKDPLKGTELINKAAELGFQPAIDTINKKQFQQPTKLKVVPGEEHLIITSEVPTLSELIEYLRMEGAGNDGQTGSRIPGRGCGNSSLSCISWDINSTRGIKEWNVFLQKYGAALTAQ
ncbi:sel1 repeat family protein [Aliikangiella marina]|uniref:Sel1 repeat family protein n=1 Tax=Aliikangiella marina TaxID=1712262 RepID=A0A545T6I8_9GAMM|nr:tetratricopeptide repeat protein [Aliikangiella marina]TQV72795.1 sel1 repeat family protein [Aliikangiella marina]